MATPWSIKFDKHSGGIIDSFIPVVCGHNHHIFLFFNFTFGKREKRN
jgi:hypothetical protein